MRSFMCHQRKQLVRLIYETFYEKHQRSTQILLFIEELYRKNLNQPEDDSIDNQLRQLKAMLQFTNTDILTQIEMALEQTTIAKTFLQHKQQPISQNSSSSSASTSVHFKDEKVKPKNSQGFIPQEDHWDRDNDQSHEEVGCKPQLDKVHKKILPENGNGYSKGIELSNTQQLASIQNRLKNMGNKLKEEETLIKLEDQTSESLEKLSSSSHFSGFEEQEEGSQIFNIHQEKKYQEYLQQLLDIQEKHGLKPTPNFLDKSFFFLRSKSQRARIKPLLKPADRAYILTLVSLLDVKQDAVRILKISRNLINSIINGTKRGQQQSQKQPIDSREEEQKEKDIHEERYKMDAYEKELQRSSSSTSMAAVLKKRGRPRKEKF